MTRKFTSRADNRSNNHYSHVEVVRGLFIPSLWSLNVSVTEVTGTIPIFFLGAPLLDGSLEAAGFVSVLWRQRQVDKSQRDVMTPTIND